jgi:mRNA interferase RelE/StbE
MKPSAYDILYKNSVSRDLKRVDKTQRKRIVQKIETRLSEMPLNGKQLKGDLRGFLSLRIGDYRVVYKVVGKQVVILAVGHRKNVYSGDF